MDFKYLFYFVMFLVVLVVTSVLFLQLDFGFNRNLNENFGESKSNLILDEVILSGDYTKCQYLESEDDMIICETKLKSCTDENCYLNQAKMNQDVDLCYNIEDESLFANCVQNIQRTTVLTSSIVEDNISVCDYFNDDANRNYCRDNFYLAKSVNENSKNFCNDIVGGNMRNECFKR